ncbi:UDP-2,4-diacetamido-2,4,6-trideoxy-beta-L-altropyranose hydrolase [Sporomusa malonica]|uniref:UDP-2,4-diacetamido-2,4,6-trideoxy-beta-L-altropyranose hydrolase n=1 Tax=Sporomusa malonica TaxID=112901 RepID=A0A1W1YW20_9FIRM|nr:UDP-2,4-diacetamido-2,4,6-trideoxy-beta-L-altropyranose hydrolase [Sporomusa malonica]SMC40326.1 UDP-2,4-diacetamido-2,4,6-trideoxy-beta-L-altropyranose hydrolase [Sporomusa malonica]
MRLPRKPNRLTIAFRADGGENIGLGHIMRCLSLAKEFRREGHKVVFLSKLTEGIERVRSENFEVTRLPSVEFETEGFFYEISSPLSEEVTEMNAFFKKNVIDILIVDTYNVSRNFFVGIKPYVSKLVYIDDNNNESFPVDILINGNITAESLGYNKHNGNQLFLLGPQYNMIRDEFRHMPLRTIREKVSEVMITTGGSDPNNLTSKIIEIILQQEEFRHLRFNVLVGSGFTHYVSLIEMSVQYDNVFLYANSAITERVRDITYSPVSAIMLRSDLAISAGGSTLYEFAASGTPVAAFIMADNQEFLVDTLQTLGYLKSLGWYDNLESRQTIEILLGMMNDFKGRKELSHKGQSLVDGKGTERIVQRIIESLQVN